MRMVATVRRSRDLRLSNLRPALLTALALAIPAVLLTALGGHELDDLYVTHMVAVGATMLVAVVAAILLTRAGTRSGDVRAVAVGTAFAAMAALLLVHALATPEVFLGEDETGLLAFAGGDLAGRRRDPLPCRPPAAARARGPWAPAPPAGGDRRLDPAARRDRLCRSSARPGAARGTRRAGDRDPG